MSSVQSFIRQIPVSTQYYNASAVVASPASFAYEFVPTSGNYVGNYPPGYVQHSASLNAAIAEAANAVGAATLTLRDMGKTIYCPSLEAPTSASFFRQVQLIRPGPITAPSGWIGGSAGNTFGVLGAPGVPDYYTNYLTFYIPVTIAGIAGLGATSSQAYAVMGGAM